MLVDLSSKFTNLPFRGSSSYSGSFIAFPVFLIEEKGGKLRLF